LACYIPRRYTRPKTVTHPGTNRARRALTSFMRRTPLTTTPCRRLGVYETSRGAARVVYCGIYALLALPPSRPWLDTLHAAPSVDPAHSYSSCRVSPSRLSCDPARRSYSTRCSVSGLTYQSCWADESPPWALTRRLTPRTVRLLLSFLCNKQSRSIGGGPHLVSEINSA